MAAVLAAACAAVMPPATATAADRPSAPDVSLLVIGADDGPEPLAEHLRDILTNPPLPQDRGIRIARADRVLPGDFFDLERPDSGQPTAWAIIDGPVIHIRAASAGRAQFVFRDLTIARPMTDLDRERVGQTLRAAITAVIEGRPGGFDRHQAQRAVDYEEPPPRAAPPLSAAVAPPRPKAPEPGGSSTGERLDPPVQLHVGAFLQMARIASDFAYAAGAIGSVEWRRRYARPNVWLSVMHFLPDAIPSASAPVAYAFSFRAGIGAAIPQVSWLHVDVGAGLDFLRSGYAPGSVQTSVYRFALRFGPTDRFGIRSSLTLSAEHVNTEIVVTNIGNITNVPLTGTDGDSRWRPCLALELWWL